MLVHAGRQVIGDLSKYAHVRQNHCPTPNEYLRYGDYECLAYLYTHAGAALYCTKSILEELAFRLRGFSPTSVLDAGFGPGIGFM